MAAPGDGTVVVLGGTGFLGRRVAARLAAHGHRVAVGTRNPEAADAPGPVRADVRVDVRVDVRADVRDPASLARALAGAAAVVNCVGLYVERGADTFQAVHVDGARAVAEAARAEGVARLVHVSGIGADAAARDAYIRARGAGEAAVRAAFPEATILRPSALFTGDAGLFAALAGIVAASPVVPLFGDGSTRLQPVHAEDVAEAAARALEADAAPGAVFELGGADVLSYREILARLAARAGRRRVFVPVPLALWGVAARAAALLPAPPLTPAQVALMTRDNVVGEGVATFADLGIAPRGPVALGLV